MRPRFNFLRGLVEPFSYLEYWLRIKSRCIVLM